MKRNYRRNYLIAGLALLGFTAGAQSYTGHGYAGGVAEQRFQMPGPEITAAFDDGRSNSGVATGYDFDIASAAGPDLAGDQNTTFGIASGTGTDTGGGDKRGYATNSSTSYTPIRWNGGSQMFRNSGQWVRYSMDFPQGEYNFVYRGNTKSYAVGSHKFDLKIYDPTDMSTPVFSRTIDLTASFPSEGALAGDVFRIGGGNVDTDWFKVLEDVSIPATGTYVVELSTLYFPFTYMPWGGFTFNTAKKYSGEAYDDDVWQAGEDVVPAWKYDKVDDGDLFTAGDKDVCVGVYGSTTTAEGDNVRGYGEAALSGALRWNTTDNTFQSTGGWYNYLTQFSGIKNYFFKFRGVPLMGDAAWDATVRVLEPKTKSEIVSVSFAQGVEYVSDADAGDATRWMYIKTPFSVAPGKYIVQIDFPVEGGNGILGEYTFTNDHPTSGAAQVVTYNWPATIPESDKYEVKVTQNGTDYSLFTHISVPDTRPSVYPDDNGGNGVMPVLYDRSLSFCQFSYTDEIIVEVKKTYGTAAHRVEIQPKAFGINPIYFDGTTVRFKLKREPNKPSYISVNFITEDNLDDMPNNHVVPKHGLMLFGDKLETYVPDKTAPNVVVYNDGVDSATVVDADIIYFAPGDYNLKDKFDKGVIVLTKDNQKVYAEGGAYVRGAVWSEDFDGIWLYGRGIFTGFDFLHHELLDEDGKKEAYMKFHGSDECHVEGIVITDPCHHSIPTGKSAYFKNVKIIGWAYNADGTRVGGGSYAEEMFYKTNDDRDYGDRGHVLKNSVMWPMRNGAFSMLGWGPYKGGNARYDNLYFINSEWERPEDRVGNQGVLGSKNKQGSEISNDTLRNLYLEDYTTILTVLRHTYDPELAFDPEHPGFFKEFLFENIKVEHPFIKTSGEQAMQRIEGYEHEGVRSSVHDITFRNLIVAGELITEANKDKYFLIDDRYASDIFFEAKGEIHTIRASCGTGGAVYPNGDIAVPEGTSQYVSIQPAEGFRIKDVKVDYQSVGRLQTVFIENATSDHVVEVEFEAGDNTFDLVSVVDVNTVLADDIDLGVDHGAGTGFTTPMADGQLRVAPNPAKNVLLVQGVDVNDEVTIYTHYGQLILTTREKNINVSHLHSGLYIVRSGNKAAKVVIK